MKERPSDPIKGQYCERIADMDDRKMDHVITKIGDPVFVGTAGQSEQSFDHIEVRVELNKELSEEDFRSAYREALLSSYRKVPEMVSRNKEFLKYKIPTECLTVSNVTPHDFASIWPLLLIVATFSLDDAYWKCGFAPAGS